MATAVPLSLPMAPKFLALDEDADRLYFAQFENLVIASGITSMAPTTANHGLTGSQFIAMAPRPDGGVVYALNPFSPAVWAIDTTSFMHQDVATPDAGGQPVDMAITPDGAKLWVTLQSDQSIMIIDTASMGVEKLVHVGQPVQHLAFDKSGRTAVVTDGTHVIIMN
jgi:YVTN family beta-propeller protein